MNSGLVTSEFISTLLASYGVSPKLSGSLQVTANQPASLAETTVETVSFCRDSVNVTIAASKNWRGVIFLEELDQHLRKSIESRQDLLVVECRYSEAMFYKLLSTCFSDFRTYSASPLDDEIFDYNSHPSIGDFSCIQESVWLAPTVAVGSNCSIRRTRIGENSVIQAGVRLGDDALGAALGPGGVWFDRPHFGGVIIESNVRVENNTVIQSGFFESTQISSNCRIGPNSSIGNGVKIGEGTLIGQSVTIAGSVSIGRGCRIWGAAAIREGTRIGDYAVVGMGSVVLRDISDHETWFGNPARRRD